jgi:hypothetical protein
MFQKQSLRIVAGGFAILIAVLVTFNFSQRSHTPIKVSAFARIASTLIIPETAPESFSSMTIIVVSQSSAVSKQWELAYDANRHETAEQLARLIKLLQESKVYDTFVTTGDVRITASYQGQTFTTYTSAAYIEHTPALQNFMQLMRVFGRPQ